MGRCTLDSEPWGRDWPPLGDREPGHGVASLQQEGGRGHASLGDLTLFPSEGSADVRILMKPLDSWTSRSRWKGVRGSRWRGVRKQSRREQPFTQVWSAPARQFFSV